MVLYDELIVWKTELFSQRAGLHSSDIYRFAKWLLGFLLSDHMRLLRLRGPNGTPIRFRLMSD